MGSPGRKSRIAKPLRRAALFGLIGLLSTVLLAWWCSLGAARRFAYLRQERTACVRDLYGQPFELSTGSILVPVSPHLPGRLVVLRADDFGWRGRFALATAPGWTPLPGASYVPMEYVVSYAPIDQAVPGWGRREFLPWLSGTRSWPTNADLESTTLGAAGWPFPALYCKSLSVGASNTTHGAIFLPDAGYAWFGVHGLVRPPLPVLPVWWGLFTNMTLHGAAWWFLWATCGFTIRGIRSRALHRQGRCRGCGYILVGVASDRCPECGEPRLASHPTIP